MKNSLSGLRLLSVCAALLTSPLVAAEFPAGAVTSVTVYPQSALVTREASVDLVSGVNEIELIDLPAALVAETLQVGGRGTAAVKILDVRVEQVFHRETRDEQLRALQDRLVELGDEKSALQNAQQVITESRAYLDRIRNYSTTYPAEGTVSSVDTSVWQQRLKFHEEELQRLLREELDLRQKQRELDRSIRQVNDEIAHLRSASARTSQTVVVKLEAASAGAFDLSLEYLVRAARWWPTYLVRVDEASNTLGLEVKAEVEQTSGESWDDVKLTLSTARPRLNSTVPELYPWRLARWEPRSRGYPEDEEVFELSRFQVTAAATGLSGNQLAAPPPPEEAVFYDAETVTGITQSGLLATTFEIPYAVSLPSKADGQTVTVATLQAPCDIYHWAIPKIAGEPFLKARVENPADFPLLPGETQVFLNGRFVAASRIEYLAPGQEMNFLLGNSPSLAIERELIEDLTESTGFGGRKTKRTFEYRFEIENHDDESTTLVLRDQLPLSNHEDIVVKLLKPSENSVEIDELGTVLWRLELQPREKRVVPLRYTVEYPADWELSGL
jgi:uncharacterized protein (TIGR02231 family)